MTQFPNVLEDSQPKPDEHALTKRVSLLLANRKPMLWFLKIHGHPMQRAGVPDYIGCYFGQMFAIELKNPSDPHYTPTRLQAKELATILKAGGKTLCTNSYDEVETFIDNLRREHYE